MNYLNGPPMPALTLEGLREMDRKLREIPPRLTTRAVSRTMADLGGQVMACKLPPLVWNRVEIRPAETVILFNPPDRPINKGLCQRHGLPDEACALCAVEAASL